MTSLKTSSRRSGGSTQAPNANESEGNDIKAACLHLMEHWVRKLTIVPVTRVPNTKVVVA